MLQDDQPVTDRDENSHGEVANSLDPHERKCGRIVDWNAEANRGPDWVEYEIDAEPNDSDRQYE